MINHPTNTSSAPLGGGVNALPSFPFGSPNPPEFGTSKAARGSEKRHRRRIKNRESAARSRARKLAYNIQKQIEIKELKKENEFLRNAIKLLSTNSKFKQDGDGKARLIRSLSGPI